MRRLRISAFGFLSGLGFRISLFCLASLSLLAADVDVSNLPPPAARQVDFTKDIKPIFERSCFRCHGAERPKSHFSLAARDTALKGGENGIDIKPGNSAGSPLIHYIARLVPDMEMPPDGKGDPLSSEQIAILRAWIDQGAAWEPVDAAAQYAPELSFQPALRWVTVSGNAQKFQEHQWIPRGISGGANHFRFAQKLTNGVVVTTEGHALTDDYQMTLDLRKPEAGFARFGFEQFRHYYDDHGPYYPFRSRGFATTTVPFFDLDRDLHLDTGKAFAEFGVTRPDWPQITVQYEYQYKTGTKSTEQWGPVSQITGGTNFTRNIFPAYKHINEDVHILRLNVSRDIAGARVEDNVRAELSDLKTRRVNDTTFDAGQLYPNAFTATRETHDQLQFANTLFASKPVNKWLFVSAGYLFSELDADATVRQTTTDASGRPAAGPFWSAPEITLKESAHVFNLNAQGGPWDGFTTALAVQTAFSETRSVGNADLLEGDPNDPTSGIPEPALMRSDIDRAAVQESVILRYTKIPATALFGDVRLKQERLGEFEEQTGGDHQFLRDTDAADNWQEYATGFDVSPWRQVSLHASYRKRIHDSNYDHNRDEQPIGTLGLGYPAFILSRDSDSDIFQTRLVFRPAPWLKAGLSYERAETDYRTETAKAATPAFTVRGGRIFAGAHDSSTYSANLTVTPWQRLSMATTFSYEESRIAATDNGSPSVVPYRGDTFTVLVSAAFVLDRNTDFTSSYSFSRARYAQNNAASGLPLGIDYDLHSVQAGLRRYFSTNITATVQYGFFDYTEPSSQHINDYTAHMVFATVAMRLP